MLDGSCRAVDHRPVVAQIVLGIVVESHGGSAYGGVPTGEENHIHLAVLVKDGDGFYAVETLLPTFEYD